MANAFHRVDFPSDPVSANSPVLDGEKALDDSRVFGEDGALYYYKAETRTKYGQMSVAVNNDWVIVTIGDPKNQNHVYVSVTKSNQLHSHFDQEIKYGDHALPPREREGNFFLDTAKARVYGARLNAAIFEAVENGDLTPELANQIADIAVQIDAKTRHNRRSPLEQTPAQENPPVQSNDPLAALASEVRFPKGVALQENGVAHVAQSSGAPRQV